ncbi:hypothetical protein [Nocardioides mangrovi]|uniref:DUF2017 family protein n=1 Tax=Nocardioides mangrovi TaxID=2874580 RepID=A0ABS7UCU7_9ACTN|nr:hypothetical protein [Nocardioides mangrovi]MBZ5738828.1 hypothetical protein [Nocardioides mangrovi]
MVDDVSFDEFYLASRRDLLRQLTAMTGEPEMAQEPTSFTVGQVSDDAADSMNASHDRGPEDAWHDLSHLIGVLRASSLHASS